MSKLRGIKKLPKLDMNPMVDMAFLLVSFFMMTTTFKADLPAEITIPFSKAQLKLPEKNICTISIDAEGRVFIGLDNKFDRKQMLQHVAQQNALNLNTDQAELFSLLPSTGLPMEELSYYLTLEGDERKAYFQQGIPFSEENNQLRNWLIGSRLANPNLRFAINGDGDASVTTVKRVFDILQDVNITRFNLVTDTEIDAAES